MNTTRQDASILAILDAEVRDCYVRIDQARLFGNGPECEAMGITQTTP